MATRDESPNEGEGNRTAARIYDAAAKHHAQTADTQVLGHEAAKEWDAFLAQLRHFDVGMLVTKRHGERLSARPMFIAEHAGDGTLRFVTSRGSHMVQEVIEQADVMVTFQEGHRYLSMAARAEVVDDPAAFAACWKESFRPWFPDGPRSPQGVVIKVFPLEAEYWDQSGLKSVRFLLQAALSYLSGRPLQEKAVGKHGSIALSAEKPTS